MPTGSRRHSRPAVCATITVAIGKTAAGSYPLPLSHLAGDDAKEWMCFRHRDAAKLTVQPRRSRSQLGFQVAPLVKQLPVGFPKLPSKPSSRNFCFVEL